MVVSVAQPGALGAVPDPRLLQRRRPVPDRGRRVPGDDPGHRLCRRGRGAVPVRRDDARHQLRGAARAGSSATCRSALRSVRCCSSSWRFVLGGWTFAPDAASAALSPASAQVSNTAALGRLLYTDYVFLFQAAGLMLLVAMIGAIVLTLRDRKTLAPSEHRGRPTRGRPTRWRWSSVGRRRRAGDRHLPPEGRGAGTAPIGTAAMRMEGIEMLAVAATYLRSSRHPAGARHLRHLPQPQERHHHPDVDRADPALGQPQPGGVLGGARRSGRARCSRCSC